MRDMKSTLEAILNDCDDYLNDEMDIDPADLIAAFQAAARACLLEQPAKPAG